VSGSGASNPGEDPVGSLGEEAAKLFAALQGWGGPKPPPGDHQHHQPHQPSSSGECRFCPVCQLLAAVRTTSPDVVEHLTAAAGSLVHAINAMMAAHMPTSRDGEETGVEKIDLSDDDAGWEDEQ
jgi:hypothetical protein